MTFASYRQYPLSNEQQQAADICEQYSAEGYIRDEAGKVYYGLYLYGPVGVGKSGLVAAICNKAFENWVSTLYRSVPDLLDMIRDSYREGQDQDMDQGQLMGRIKAVDLLVLDDLGTERPSSWVIEKLFQIVDYRYRHELRTLVTSNYSPAELVEKWGGDTYGYRIVDRLLEMCLPVPCFGSNLRGLRP